VAVGSYNLQNLTTGQYNTAIGQGLMVNLMSGSSNLALGYEASDGYESTKGLQMGSNNIAVGNFAGSGTNDTAVSNNIYISPNTVTSATGISNSIMLPTLGISNVFLNHGGGHCLWHLI